MPFVAGCGFSTSRHVLKMQTEHLSWHNPREAKVHRTDPLVDRLDCEHLQQGLGAGFILMYVVATKLWRSRELTKGADPGVGVVPKTTPILLLLCPGSFRTSHTCRPNSLAVKCVSS